MSFLPFFSAETWILLITFICLFVWHGSSTFGVFEKLGIPGPKPLMYYGTLTRHNYIYFLADTECAQKYGRVFGLYEFRKPMLVVTDPDMLKTILVKECFTYFTNRRNFYLNGELYDAVNIAEDDQWRRIRHVLSPSFTSGRIKEVGLHGDVEESDPDNVCFSLAGAYSMDVMASCAFSVDLDTFKNPSSPFITHAGKLFFFFFKYTNHSDDSQLINLFSASGWFPIFLPLMKLLGISFYNKSSTAFFKRFVERVRAQRSDDSRQKSRDIFQHMINSQTDGLTDHEIISQATMMVFAGYETNASALTFLAYSLATNPQIMKRLQREIDSTFPNKESIQYEALMQMEYLDCVVSECLRLYPPALRLERVAKETVKINGVTVPKGMLVMVPVYALHRDPELWPEPEEFRPERFSKEKKQHINPYSYLTFGIGPRNCLGMRFALAAVKLALVEILQSYSFSVCEETEIPLKMSNAPILDTDSPIKLKVVKRPDGDSWDEDIIRETKAPVLPADIHD
uniref:unspecific monooxygenase n=1 Tax=Salarias fasciatus TaxID=181472 RepID=A0A672IWW1_SALFA